MSEKKQKILVIGAGASGMMAAIAAAEEGAEVKIIEKNEKCGKKLFITGKGRCNLTNACEISVFFDNIVHGDKFLRSAVNSFNNTDLCAFFENSGLSLKVERGNRVFPLSDKSSDVIKVLEDNLKKHHVKVILGSETTEIYTENGCFKKIKVKRGREEFDISGDAVIISTGGLTYPATGSDGAGYKFAKSMGHSITPLEPSLTSFICSEYYTGELEGLSLKNVEIKIKKEGRKKVLYREFGEMVFTDKGVSGPVILSASAIIGRDLNNDFRRGRRDYRLYTDLKPALSEAQLDKRILRDFEDNKNRDFKNSLKALLPSKIIPVIIRLSGIDENKKVNSITKKERASLLNLLKEFPLTPLKTGDFDEAVVTSGGVNLNEINPKTMESKLIKGVYFAGEVIDADALTGGYNLQIAFSTGYLAGRSAVKEA